MSRISIYNYALALYLATDELDDPKVLGEQFNRLLAKNKQKKILSRILTKLDEIMANESRNVNVIVETARPLENESREKIKSILEQKLAKSVTLTEIINPKIIGGLRLKIGETKYNSAVLDKLQLMKEQVHG